MSGNVIQCLYSKNWNFCSKN